MTGVTAKKIKKVTSTKNPVSSKEAWEDGYAARFNGSQFGDDAIGLFALGLQFNIDDLDAVGAESITGGGGDKKCDLFYFDKEDRRCVIAQCYLSKKSRQAAPSNKASDLSTAINWLLTAPLSKVPAGLKANASELRAAIKNDELDELSIWYVHNCPESKNVQDEIEAVEHSAAAAIKSLKSGSQVKILATFRRKISDFWIVADEVRKARPAALAAGVI
jgi:hypothetical protein